MKKTICKLFCLLMSFLMATSLFIPVTAANRTGGAVPVVYIQGQGCGIVDGTGKMVSDIELPDGYITDAVKACMPSFLKAVASADGSEEWKTYSELLSSYVAPLFEEIQLDDNGEICDDTHVNWSWNRAWLWNKINNGVYAIDAYCFQQDWRLDPLKNAKLLDDYIQAIKEVTGSDKVNLVGRCEGGNVIMAYLAEFGYGDINCIEFYCHSVLGVDLASSVFSGNIYIDSASAERYLDENVDIEDNVIAELVTSTLVLAKETYGLDLTAAGLTLLARRLYKNTLTDLIMQTYGTFPGIWSLVGPEDYAEARKNVFAGKEEQYAGLIEKLDDYDSRVRSKTNELLTAAAESGVKIGVFAKYGYQSPPLARTNNDLEDNTVTLANSTFGATCAKINSTLSAQYLENAEANGTAKYISPEKNVDMSTAMFPDTTWIIKNNDHRYFPDTIHDFMSKFFHANGEMTVFSDPTAPQYMVYDNETGTLSPMTAENTPIPTPEPQATKTKESFKEMALRFVRALFDYIKQLLGIVD